MRTGRPNGGRGTPGGREPFPGTPQITCDSVRSFGSAPGRGAYSAGSTTVGPRERLRTSDREIGGEGGTAVKRPLDDELRTIFAFGDTPVGSGDHGRGGGNGPDGRFPARNPTRRTPTDREEPDGSVVHSPNESIRRDPAVRPGAVATGGTDDGRPRPVPEADRESALRAGRPERAPHRLPLSPRTQPIRNRTLSGVCGAITTRHRFTGIRS